MATSDTYAYAPGLGEMVLYAFNLAQIRSTALTQEHMFSARMAANMMQSRWANKGPNLWAIDLVTVTLVQTPTVVTASVSGGVATLTYATPDTPVYLAGQDITVAGVGVSGYNGDFTVLSSGPGYVTYASGALANSSGGTISTATPTATYSVAPSTIMILDAYMAIDQNSAPETDRIILPVSRTEYASYPNKTQTGFSTVFWFDRLISPTVTLWPVPDGTSAQYLKYYRVRQIQDAVLAGNLQPEIPYRFLEAYADGLSYRLAKIWNPSIAAMLKTDAAESFADATIEDTENVQYYISPQISSYFRV
jgi:hypothetical protein